LKKKLELENSYINGYNDSTEFFFNYSIDAEGDRFLLYSGKQTDRAAIYSWYNPKTNITSYSIKIELRKALFVSDENNEVHLPNHFIEQNFNLIDCVLDKFINYI
jgi:hypothetical protein